MSLHGLQATARVCGHAFFARGAHSTRARDARGKSGASSLVQRCWAVWHTGPRVLRESLLRGVHSTYIYR